MGDHAPPDWLSELEGVTYFNLGAKGKLQFPAAFLRLRKILSDQKVDILHTHLYYASFFGAILNKVTSKPVVVMTRHYTAVVKMLGTRFHVLLDRWIAQNVKHRIAPSLGTKNYMLQEDKITKPIDLVYYGFDFEVFSTNLAARKKIRAEFGFSDQDLVVGYVGNFANGKGHLQIVQAFALVKEKIPSAKLFLVGKGNLDEVDDAVNSLGLTDDVVFTGWREDVPACMNAMDIFVQPSLSEAFSQVLIEAMAVGLPSIATEVGGAREVLGENENGILIQANDISAMAEAIIAFYIDPDKRSDYAQKGKKFVLENFSKERMVKEHIELYKNWL